MTASWACSDFLIVDSCCEALPRNGDWSENLSADVCADVLILGAPVSHFADWDTPEEEIELTEPSLDDIPRRRVRSPLAQINWGAAIEMDCPATDLASGLQGLWKPLYRPLAARSTRFSGVLLSALIHVSALFLFVFIPVQHVGGSTGHEGTVITVQVAPSEDLIPQDESPASLDSAASLPSIAKKAKEPLEKRTPESLDQPQEMSEAGPRPTAMAVMEKPPPPDKQEEAREPEKEVAKKTQEQETGDGLQDSVASTPSTASAERRFIPASGQGQNAFEAMVLSAIREAIFFPKQAVNERHYGEVVVAFAINRDGSVSDLNVEKSSGSMILDEAATRIIQKAAKKFPPIPDTMYRERLEYVVPILFKERRGT
jgi:periplasmic protein TonB